MKMKWVCWCLDFVILTVCDPAPFSYLKYHKHAGYAHVRMRGVCTLQGLAVSSTVVM